MIALEMEQGTEAWFQARIGIPTASNFDKLLTIKGEPSTQAEKYLWQLAGERITGKPKATYTNGAMQNGQFVEDEARSFYELVTGVEVRRVGICYANEDRKVSCSPDSLVGEDGGLEIKCPEIQTHVGYLVKKNLLTDYFQQVQGSLFVTGRQWWDVVSYFPGIKPVIIRVQRDEVFIGKLEAYLKTFCKELEETVLKLSEEV